MIIARDSSCCAKQAAQDIEDKVGTLKQLPKASNKALELNSRNALIFNG